MRPHHDVLLLVLLATVPAVPSMLPTPAEGAVLAYRWDDCARMDQNLLAAGQTHVRQVVTASGLGGSPGAFTLVLSLGPSFDGVHNPWICALASAAPSPGALLPGVGPASAGPCPVVPGLQATGEVNGCVTPDGCRAFVTVHGFIPQGTVLDPAQTYALVQLDYDLTRLGQSSGPCANLTVPPDGCFGLVFASLTSEPYHGQHDWVLSWNRADGNSDACVGVVPARTTTWGTLKAIYR